ncbi:S46 family peptidase, partial [uncultured Xanthomonas sp.]
MPLPNCLAASLTLSLALTTTAHADEGMWMPSQMPELAKPLHEAGFQGDPQTLAEVTQPP